MKNELTKLLTTWVFDLLDHIDQKEDDSELEREIEEALEIQIQEEANADVNMILSQEDPMDNDQMEGVIDERMQTALAPMQAKIKKLRQQLQSKGTGGRGGHPSNASNNGQQLESSLRNSNNSSKDKKVSFEEDKQ